MSPSPSDGLRSALPSLLDEATLESPAPSVPRTGLRGLTPERALLVKRLVALAGLSFLLLGGVLLIFALAPRPEPDFLEDDMGGILDYTLLSDDFNKLPIERRMELLKELVTRLKTMSGTDSAAMAAFAATIRREMREQIERNLKRLAVDTIDIYARDYAATPPGEQERFLDEAAIGFTRMLEDIAGERSPLPQEDGARLAAIKEQARRDEEMFRENDSRPTARRVAAFFEFIHDDQENVSDPVQRGRNAKFMRDMTRHLRGQDIATGKPVSGPR